MAKHNVRVDDETIEIDDAQFDIESSLDGLYIVADGSRRWRVYVAGPPDDRWVSVDGHAARIEVITAGQARPRRSAAHDMTAPMPATVVEVLVAPGAAVNKGDTLLMLEAMKMELAIRAARTGVVRAVNCKPGELVQPGVQLVELEP